jgi:hypothetical protein
MRRRDFAQAVAGSLIGTGLGGGAIPIGQKVPRAARSISASASQEQSTGVEQVTAAVTQMDRVTRSNSAEPVRLTSTALASQAVQLQEMVACFRLTDDTAENEGFPGDERGGGRPTHSREKMALVESF